MTVTKKEFYVFIERDEDGYYVGEVPQLKACYSQGETIDELMNNIKTEDIFISIFNESQFHQENNIARELHLVVNTFFTGAIKKNTFAKINSYYNVIKRTAANIANHHEKQKFLKAIYENFYQAYNPKAADRLGIVYTPNEIVRFMVESVDYLTHKHFGKLLADEDVHIIEPAVGTGTFVTELIEYIPKNKLKHKYQNEIHCNEVAILPYYIANLNIEYTYKQKMGEYEEFNNICLVDTLEHTCFEGKQGNLFHLSVENTERIDRQNNQCISVIIGNPPYNANQENENDNNKNHKYPEIDKRIKESYIKQGKAQAQMGVYDMYTRFIRWATDRLDKNGIVAFVSNNSFIEALAFNGFRKVVAEEFNEIWIVDTKGNARTSGERRRKEGGNVFSDKIRVGVAIYYLVRNQQTEGFKIFYNSVSDYAKAEEKKNYFSENHLKDLNFHHIVPDKNHNWLNQVDNNFETLLPIADKKTRLAKSIKEERSLFKLFSQGVKTNRDNWVYDNSFSILSNKVKYLIEEYNLSLDKYSRLEKSIKSINIDDFVGNQIKWTRSVKRDIKNNVKYKFEHSQIQQALYRPFTIKLIYSSKKLNEDRYRVDSIFPQTSTLNKVICFSDFTCNKPFHCLASNKLVDYHFTGDSQCLPLYRYDKSGNRTENITDWGLKQFHNYYEDENITKLDIFHYTYAVLHNPAYREKYELNLKREFPRIPFYDNFRHWVAWGRQLMDLHINYETIEPYTLKRVDIRSSLTPLNKGGIKAKLQADKDKGIITLDTDTSLHGIPPEAWEYKLGNRSALEWILDQYKEKKPKDKTIADKFNTYRFADYKEQVIDLLQRVCTVSVETVSIIDQMKKIP